MKESVPCVQKLQGSNLTFKEDFRKKLFLSAALIEINSSVRAGNFLDKMLEIEGVSLMFALGIVFFGSVNEAVSCRSLFEYFERT